MMQYPEWYDHYLKVIYLDIIEIGIMLINLCPIYRIPGLKTP